MRSVQRYAGSAPRSDGIVRATRAGRFAGASSHWALSRMDTVVLSSKYQLVLPRGVRKRLGLRPGAKFTRLDKGGVIYLVPERPMKAYRGIASGTSPRRLRERKDRL